VQRWQRTCTITAGVISVDLEPNSTATPAGTSYYVVYRPTSGLAWSERWVVTVSATALKVSEVRVATTPIPAVMIQPSQILSGAATTGQVLAWSGSAWAAATSMIQPSQILSAGAAAGQVLAWDGSAWAPATRPGGSGATNALAVWSDAQTLAGSALVTVDEANHTVNIYPGTSMGNKTTVQFLGRTGDVVSTIDSIGLFFGGSGWDLSGFGFNNVRSMSLNSYMQAPGYRMFSDSNQITSPSHNFGKLFDGLASGSQTFYLKVSVTAPVFDLAGSQPGYITLLEFCQDTVGGRTITFPSTIRFGPLDTTPSKCTSQLMVSRGSKVNPLAPAVSY
jgi:hypothetical protein